MRKGIKDCTALTNLNLLGTAVQSLPEGKKLAYLLDRVFCAWIRAGANPSHHPM